MYARHEFHRLIGTRTEAELLGELWTCHTVLLSSSSDSFDGVRGLYCRIEGLPKKAALYFCYKGRGVLLRTEGTLHIPVGCYNTAGSGHLELEVSIMRHRLNRANAVRPSSA